MHAERFESALWRTSSLLLVAGREAVVVDPCISRDEVGRIAARADELGARVAAVLATHADWDHVCGIAAFPEAEAAMGELTAARVESGEPWAEIESQAAAYGVEVTGAPRVDRRLRAGAAPAAGRRGDAADAARPAVPAGAGGAVIWAIASCRRCPAEDNSKS